jgi:hypothetical protein
MIKITSIFRQPIRQLISTSQSLIPYQKGKNIHLIYALTNMRNVSFKNFKSIANDFWKQKYNQYLSLEISRVLIDDKEYLYDKHDGILAELR